MNTIEILSIHISYLYSNFIFVFIVNALATSSFLYAWYNSPFFSFIKEKIPGTINRFILVALASLGFIVLEIINPIFIVLPQAMALAYVAFIVITLLNMLKIRSNNK